MTITSLIKRAIERALRFRLYDSARLYLEFEAAHLRKIFDRFRVDCVFDVGANKGQYAQMLRRKAGYKGRIISFEPNPEAAAIAASRLSNDPLWSIEILALSQSTGTQTLNIMQNDEFTSLSEPVKINMSDLDRLNTPQKTIEVRTETLDTAFKRLKEQYGFQRPFLKLDTQGYDLIVARSGEEIIKEFVGLQSELAIVPLYEQSTRYSEAIAEYQRMGFSVSALVPNNAGHFPVLLETDCIMINKTHLPG